MKAEVQALPHLYCSVPGTQGWLVHRDPQCINRELCTRVCGVHLMAGLTQISWWGSPAERQAFRGAGCSTVMQDFEIFLKGMRWNYSLPHV